MLYHGQGGRSTARSLLSWSELSNRCAGIIHWQALKMDMLALIIMCIGYKSTDLRPKAVRFVLYANGSQLTLWKLKCVQTRTVKWKLPAFTLKQAM